MEGGKEGEGRGNFKKSYMHEFNIFTIELQIIFLDIDKFKSFPEFFQSSKNEFFKRVQVRFP